MKTTTSTQVTHYEVQKKRRESLLEEWRGYHKTVLKRKDVVMHDDPHRRSRRGVYAGWDGDRPTKNLDATIHELPAGLESTTIHRHSWDALMFIESGSGWTEIDGVRIDHVDGLTDPIGYCRKLRARFDAISAPSQENQVSPRINVVWEPNDFLTVHAGYARYFTPPPLGQIGNAAIATTLGTTARPAVTANDPLKAERSNYFSGGFEVRPLDGLKFGFDAYGVSQDMPDPVARSMQAMLDHMHAVDERIERMCSTLRKLDASYRDGQLPELRDEDFADILDEGESGCAGSGKHRSDKVSAAETSDTRPNS